MRVLRVLKGFRVLSVSKLLLMVFEGGLKMWLPWILRSREFVSGFLMIAKIKKGNL